MTVEAPAKGGMFHDALRRAAATARNRAAKYVAENQNLFESYILNRSNFHTRGVLIFSSPNLDHELFCSELKLKGMFIRGPSPMNQNPDPNPEHEPKPLPEPQLSP